MNSDRLPKIFRRRPFRSPLVPVWRGRRRMCGLRRTAAEGGEVGEGRSGGAFEDPSIALSVGSALGELLESPRYQRGPSLLRAQFMGFRRVIIASDHPGWTMPFGCVFCLAPGQTPESWNRCVYENLTATDWGWTKHLFFHFVFVFIIIFFSCPFVSFFHVNVCFRLHHHFFYTPTGAFSCVIAFIVCVPWS